MKRSTYQNRRRTAKASRRRNRHGCSRSCQRHVTFWASVGEGPFRQYDAGGEAVSLACLNTMLQRNRDRYAVPVLMMRPTEREQELLNFMEMIRHKAETLIYGAFGIRPEEIGPAATQYCPQGLLEAGPVQVGYSPEPAQLLLPAPPKDFSPK